MVNICSLDLSKAFDRMSHQALFCKTNAAVNSFKSIEDLRILVFQHLVDGTLG